MLSDSTSISVDNGNLNIWMEFLELTKIDWCQGVSVVNITLVSGE